MFFKKNIIFIKIVIFLLCLVLILSFFSFYKKKKVIESFEPTIVVSHSKLNVSPEINRVLTKEEKKKLEIIQESKAVLVREILPSSNSIGPINVIKIDYTNQSLDTDEDGLSDEEEKRLNTNPKKWDTDEDGINDKKEKELGIDPLKIDTDGDNINDMLEIKTGTDPKIANKF